MSESSTHREGRIRLVAGRYRVLRELGHGGMGIVWLADDPLTGRRVAIKELRPRHVLPEAERAEFTERALREARNVAQIQHPNAVTLYDVLPATADDDAVYLIMEYIDGPTLAALIQQNGRLPGADVACLGLQLLDVLAAAHKLGIVHRDIKPANIILAAGNTVKLTDFGIAYAIGDTRLTSPGKIGPGTWQYMAPEQFEPKAVISPTADLWSLGATLFHAVEGCGPFDRDTVGAMLSAIKIDDLPVPRCGAALATAITGMLQRDPARRASIDQARTWLTQTAGPASPVRPGWEQATTSKAAPPRQTQPPPAPPPRPPQPHRLARIIGPPGARRRGRITAFIAAAVLAIGGGVTGGVLAAGSTTVSIGGLLATITLPGGDSDTGADSLAVNADGTLVAANGAGNNPSAPTPGAVWDATGGGTTTNLPSSSAAFTGSAEFFVAFSPDGRTLAFDGPDGAVDLWSIADHKVVATLPEPPSSGSAIAAAFSPDGKILAVTADGDSIQLWDAGRRALTSTLGTPSQDLSGTVAFGGDGTTVAVGSGTDGTVRLWDVVTRRLIATVPAAFGGKGVYGPADWAALNPDGSLLAVASAGKQASGVRLWDVATGTWLATMTDPHTDGVSGIAFSPDGRTLAVADVNGSVYLWDVGARKIAASRFVTKLGLDAVAFTADGKALAVSDYGDHVYLWNIIGA